MRILHIGDLHFKPKNTYEQNRLIEAFIRNLKGQPKVDFIFFSGDLVNSGSNANDFNSAHEYLFTPLLNIFSLTEHQLFICQGNHDVNWDSVIGSVIRDISANKLTGDDLDYWIRTNPNDTNASLKPSENYFNYVKNKFQYPSSDILDVYRSVHKRIVDNQTIGIVTINSSWLSANKEDKGTLLFSPNMLKEMVNEIKNCDFKVLMLHHPLEFFKEPILFEIEDLVHSNFNIMLSGHLHKESIETQYKCRNGIFCNTTKASLCYDQGQIGYTILNFQFEDPGVIKLERAHYIATENEFINLETVIVQVPIGDDKYKQNNLRKKVTEKFLTEIEESNQLLLNYDDEQKRGFLQSFTDPVLSKDSDEQASTGEKFSRIRLEDVKNGSNYVIFGKDKCGKTSLLKKLQLDWLHEYSHKGLLPIFLDYKVLELSLKEFDLPKMISQYYQINRAESQKLLEEGRIVLLIDNLDITSSLHNEIISFLSNNVNVRFIICSEYLTSRVFSEDLDDLSYDKLFFKNLTRTEIRSYAKKAPNIKSDDYDIIIDRVMKFCTQLQLPLNYWTVSMIFLIYKKGNDDYTKNLFSILDACVDEILQKRRFLFEKTNLNFEQYKTLCSEIAYYLYLNHKESQYSALSSDIISKIDSYISDNPRIPVSGKEIFDYLFDCGIFRKKVDSSYTFRLNGIFEYFLAYYIKENPLFRDQLLTNDTDYLLFKNELEIYSGFNRSDLDFLKRIFEKTKRSLIILNTKYYGNIDELLLNKIDEVQSFDKEIKNLLISKPLSDEQRDKAFDAMDVHDINTEVRLKVQLDTSTLNVELIERYLSVLSRVFRNIDAIKDSQLIYEIFDYLLESYCQFGFYMVDEFERIAKKENVELRKESELAEDVVVGQEILTLLSKILPIIIQVMLFDNIGQMNFKKIIEEKIAQYRTDVSNNQYKLFVLYFLIIDLDLKTQRNIIDDAILDLRLGPLKISTLFKLNFYLAFNAHISTELEQFIKNKIQMLQLKINDKADIGEIQRALSKKSKRNMINKRKHIRAK